MVTSHGRGRGLMRPRTSRRWLAGSIVCGQPARSSTASGGRTSDPAGLGLDPLEWIAGWIHIRTPPVLRAGEVAGAVAPRRSRSGASPWVRLGPGRRYFETEDGEPFLIIGQNDALTWPELEGLLGRRDLPAVDRHLAWLKAHGVTTLRVMLEYVGDGLYLERRPGEFDPVTVQASTTWSRSASGTACGCC